METSDAKQEQWNRIQNCWQEFNKETFEANIEYILAMKKSLAKKENKQEPGGKASGNPIDAEKGWGDVGKVFQSWQTMVWWAQSAGYKLEHPKSGWELLGIPRAEGNTPTVEIIEERAGRLVKALEIPVCFGHWLSGKTEGMEHVHATIREIDNARTQVLEELKQVQRDKQIKGDATLPRYMEPPWGFEAAVLQKILNSTGETPISALWLSDIRGSKGDQSAQGLEVEEARKVASLLCKGEAMMKEAFENAKGAPILIWAPEIKDHLHRLLASYRRLAIQRRVSSLWVVCPREPIPDSSKDWVVDDLGTQTIGTKNWGDIIEARWHVVEPGLVLMSNETGPVTTAKAFTIYGLGMNAEPECKSSFSWKKEEVEEKGWEAIWVEGRVSDSLKIRRRLETASGREVDRWEGPLMGMGSTTKEPTVMYKGWLQSENIPAVEIANITRTLAKRLTGMAMVGSQRMITDKSARTLEVGDSNAALEAAHLCDQILMIKPRMALIHTSNTKQCWEDHLSNALRWEPAAAATCIRWRKSEHGGKIFARAQQLEQAKKGSSTMARVSQHRADILECTLEMSFPGAVGARPLDMLQSLAEKAGQVVGLKPAEAEEGEDLEAGEWAPILNHRGDYQGALKMRCRNAGEASAIWYEWKQATVSINGELQAVTVYCAALDGGAGCNRGICPAAPGSPQILTQCLQKEGGALKAPQNALICKLMAPPSRRKK